jgi:hypothetical protein
MDSDIERMIGVTGMAVPLAARIVSVIIDSGASGVEISTALSIVRNLSDLFPVSLMAEGVCAAELHPRAS